jgi:hypothetical protein
MSARIRLISGTFAGQRLPEPLPCPVCGGWAWPIGSCGDFWCAKCGWVSWQEPKKRAALKVYRPDFVEAPEGAVVVTGVRKFFDKWGNVVMSKVRGW